MRDRVFVSDVKLMHHHVGVGRNEIFLANFKITRDPFGKDDVRAEDIAAFEENRVVRAVVGLVEVAVDEQANVAGLDHRFVILGRAMQSGQAEIPVPGELPGHDRRHDSFVSGHEAFRRYLVRVHNILRF